MTWKRSSSHGDPPPDPVGDVIAETLLDLMPPAEVELSYTRVDDPAPPPPDGWAAATGDGPPGWRLTVIVRPAGRIAPLVDTQPTFKELVSILPEGTLRAADVLR